MREVGDVALSEPRPTIPSDGVASMDRLRVTVIGDRDGTIAGAFGPTHQVHQLRSVSSMEPIVDQGPDLVVVGQPHPADAATLTAWSWSLLPAHTASCARCRSCWWFQASSTP